MKRRTRERTRNRTYGGSWYVPSNGYHVESTSARDSWQYTEDYIEKVEKGVNGPFLPSDPRSNSKHPLRKLLPPSNFKSIRMKYTTFLGSYTPPNGLGRYFDGYATETLDSRGPVSKTWDQLDYDDIYYANLLVERTNPFSYIASLPVLALELVEALSLVSGASKTLLGAVGGSYLNYKFGWSTLAQDVRSLASITKAIEQRVADYNSLFKDGGLQKRSGLGSFTFKESTKSQVLSSRTGTLVMGKSKYEHTQKTWGSIRYYVDPSSPIKIGDLKQLNLRLLAAMNLLDLEGLDAYTAWEAIPFSWLIDYFADIGSSLSVTEIPEWCKFSHVCIMRKRTSRRTFEDLEYLGPVSMKLVRPNAELCYKLRTVVPESLVGKLPAIHGLDSSSSWYNTLALLAVIISRWS